MKFRALLLAFALCATGALADPPSPLKPGGGGSGTVTSVSITVPSPFSISGVPISTTGTAALTWTSGQTANRILATPDGTTGAVSLRALAAGDIPSIDTSKLGSGTLGVARGGTSLSSYTAKGSMLIAGSTSTLLDLPVGSNNQVLTADSAQTSGVKWATPTTGTVTSVSLTAPAEISVAGIPIAGSGTIALTWASAAQNAVFAGPSGSSGTPSFRALVAGDIPSIDTSKLGSGTLGVARGGTGLASYTKGDLIVTPGSTTLNKLAVGSDGQVLTADAASTNGVKWAASGGITGTLTSTRIPIASGTSTVTDTADLTYDDSTNTLNVGASDAIVTTAGNLTIQSTGTNKNITLTPTGTGKVALSTQYFEVPNGGQSTPSIRFVSGSNNYGLWYNSGGNSVVMTAGGANAMQWSGTAITYGTSINIQFQGKSSIDGGSDQAVSANGYYLSFTNGVATDKAGAKARIIAGLATGNASTGSLSLQTGFQGTASSSTNVTAYDRLYIRANQKALTDAATGLFEVALGSGTFTSGYIIYTVYASDGTDFQTVTGMCPYAACNKGGSYTIPTLTQVGETKALSAGTLSLAFDMVSGTNKVTFRVTPTGSLTETTYWITYQIFNNSPAAITEL